MLRQYFMGLRTVGKWKHLSQHWVEVAERCESPVSPVSSRGNPEFPSLDAVAAQLPADQDREKMIEDASDPWAKFLRRRFSVNVRPHRENYDSDFEGEDEEAVGSEETGEETDEEGGEEEDDDDSKDGGARLDFEILLMRKFFSLWAKKAGVVSSVCDALQESEVTVDWTRCIAPVTDGRIIMVED